MKLHDWLTNNKLSADQFGKIIGVTAEAVRHWRMGKRFPATPYVDAIAKATNGAVTANDLHAACIDQIEREKAA